MPVKLTSQPIKQAAAPFVKPRLRRRLLSIAHSYVVALNRRLAHEMARVGAGEWEVTAVAPSFIQGDLRPIPLEDLPTEQCTLKPVKAYLTNRIHFMLYEPRLRHIVTQPWDLVHCWQEPYVLSCYQVARWVRKETPFVFWTAQNLSKNYPPPFSWIEKYCLARCEGWLACGDSIVSTLLPRGYDQKPFRVMPLGVETKRFFPDPAARMQVRQALGWGDSAPLVIGYSGRFVAEKGIQLLMGVLEQLALPWRALFLGGGPLESSLRKWAKPYGDRVRILTNITHEHVAEYLNAMDVLCAPSQTLRTWREQQGRMLIEAFACGVPVIASDSGEIPNVVRDAGLIVPERDERGWAEAVSTLLENSAHRQELTAKGLERIHRTYTWPVIARQHLDFFNELLDQRHESASS